MKIKKYEYPVPEHQADAYLNQANPTSGTKYTVLDTTRNVKILAILVQCTWTVQPSPLEIHITVDGQTLRCWSNTPASDTIFFVNPGNGTLITSTDATLISASVGQYLCGGIIEGRSIKVEAEITGGTVSNLSARVKYAKW